VDFIVPLYGCQKGALIWANFFHWDHPLRACISFQGFLMRITVPSL
jgi:hypothetical protein